MRWRELGDHQSAPVRRLERALGGTGGSLLSWPKNHPPRIVARRLFQVVDMDMLAGKDAASQPADWRAVFPDFLAGREISGNRKFVAEGYGLKKGDLFDPIAATDANDT